jgi:hypothetical protein
MFTNILGFSRGSGGGTVPPWYPELTRTENGLINFDREWEINTNNIDENFHPSLNRSVIALRKGVHENYWGTFISSIKYDWNNLTFNLGFDGKIYEAQNFNKLSNLLGGDYYIGSNNVNLDQNQLLRIGDKVDFNAESFTRSFGGFAQIEYKNERFSGYINLALSKTSYNRIDHFNYLLNDPRRETGWKDFTSRTIKLGFNYNLNKINSFYINFGNFSRAPLSDNVFDYSNNIYENVKNENIISFEGGYRFKTDVAILNINYYNTLWDDKAFSQTYLNSDSTSLYYYNIFGASAKHSGIELNGKLILTSEFILNSSLSYSSHKWGSDVDAYLRPESNPSDEIKYKAFTKGLYVGNHPMTNATFGIIYQSSITPDIQFYINPVYSFHGKYYAEYDPELRTDESERGVQPWRIPDFFNFDLHSGINIELNDFFLKSVDFSFNIFNLLNEDYIIDAIDGINHNSSSANVWYGNRRWWSTSLSLSF